MELNKEEMNKIDGGFSLSTAAGIGAAIIYFIGIISGYTNPTRCGR